MRSVEPPDAPVDAPVPLVELLRLTHTEMVDALLSGDGMREVASIAARRIGGPVAVVIPELGHELIEPAEQNTVALLVTLVDYVRAGLAGREVGAPDAVEYEVPVRNGGSVIGAVLLLGPARATDPDGAGAVLHLAAMVTITDLALAQERQQVEEQLRGSFLEDLRAGREISPPDLIRRASRLGCDLSRGAAVLAGAPAADRTHRYMAAVRADFPKAFIQRLDGRVYAVLPVGEVPDAQNVLMALVGGLARRLRAHCPVGTSTFYANPAELGRAIAEADLILDVAGRTGLTASRLADGTYRMLLQLLASDPGHLERYYQESIAVVVRYDDQYGTDLVGTLGAYLDHDCRMAATASALFAHRHTVAYRLERIRELSNLDPGRHEDRERLSLGLKIHRLTRLPPG